MLRRTQIRGALVLMNLTGMSEKEQRAKREILRMTAQIASEPLTPI